MHMYGDVNYTKIEVIELHRAGENWWLISYLADGSTFGKMFIKITKTMNVVTVRPKVKT